MQSLYISDSGVHGAEKLKQLTESATMSVIKTGAHTHMCASFTEKPSNILVYISNLSVHGAEKPKQLTSSSPCYLYKMVAMKKIGIFREKNRI